MGQYSVQCSKTMQCIGLKASCGSKVNRNFSHGLINGKHNTVTQIPLSPTAASQLCQWGGLVLLSCAMKRINSSNLVELLWGWICLGDESRSLVFLIGLMNLFRLCLRGKENASINQSGKTALLPCDPWRNISLKSTRRVGSCGLQPSCGTESRPVLHCCPLFRGISPLWDSVS